MKRSKVCSTDAPEEEIRENEKEVTSEQTMAKNYLELKKLSSDSRTTMIHKKVKSILTTANKIEAMHPL